MSEPKPAPKFKLKTSGSTGGETQPRSIFVQKMISPGKKGDDAPEDPWQTLVNKAISNGDEIIPAPASPTDDQPIHGQIGEIGKSIIEPPLTPTELELIVTKNTILPTLIETMEVNIDGTGYELVPIDPDKTTDDMDEEGEEDEAEEEDKKKPGQTNFEPKPKTGKPGDEDDKPSNPGPDIERDLVSEAKEQADKEQAQQEMIDEARKPLSQFFDECFPGMSFLSVRRALRKDQERVGYAYMETLRNDALDVIFVRRLDPKKMRMLRLDSPRPVEKTVERDGKEVKILIHMRDRRFIQRIGNTVVYFKEFGADRDLNRTTGEWVDAGSLPAEERATEVLFFKNKDDVSTPYGVPRWLSNIPSVVGSRKAEEFNLEFFDAGGVPPMMIVVQGGQLAADVEQQLQDHFMSTGPSRHQVAILEAYGAGDMDSSQNVKVTVERFGAEQQKDSMFEGYIEKCDARVRRSFRLPSIFIGEAESFNFATAFASYTVAEAQVFGPERMEFDEVINLQLMPELTNGRDFKYHSLPLAVRDVAQQLEGLALVADLVEPGSYVDTVNNLTGMELQPKSEEAMQKEADRKIQELNATTQVANQGDPNFQPNAGAEGKNPGEAGGDGNGTPTGSAPTRKMILKDADNLLALAQAGSEILAKGISTPAAASEWIAHKEQVAALDARGREAYSALLTAETFEVLQNDPEGMVELTGCVAEVRAGRSN